MIPLGLSTAAAVRVGRAYGARDRAALNLAAGVAFAVAASFGALVALLVWPSARLIAHGYTSDARTIALAGPALAFACLFFVPDALQVVAAQSLRARGDVWPPTVTHLASYIAVMAPLAWWLALPMGLGLTGIVLGVIIASFVSAGLLLGRFWLLSRRPI
jgi:MATE family multidrug resistance protein